MGKLEGEWENGGELTRKWENGRGNWLEIRENGGVELDLMLI